MSSNVLAWPERMGALIKQFGDVEYLSEKSGITIERIRLFRDGRADPTITELAGLVRSAGVNPGFLLTGEGNLLGPPIDLSQLQHVFESVEAELARGSPRQKAEMALVLYRTLATYKPDTA